MLLDCTAATHASLAAGVGGGAAAGWRHPTTICCRDASRRMGRRRDRRHATLGGGGGRRVKLDLWPDDDDVPSKLTEHVTAPHDQPDGGDDESQFGSAAGVAPSPRQQTVCGRTGQRSLNQTQRVEIAAGSSCHIDAGPVVENPLALLGQYSDEDLDDGDEAEEHAVEKKETGCPEASSEAGARPVVEEQVASFMAHLQTTGLLEEENGGAAAPIPAADVVHGLEENGCCTVSNSSEARADMVSDIAALGVNNNDKLLSPTNVVNQQAAESGGPRVADVRLSDGWKAVLHGESGRYYFWNTVTGETTWETPLAAVDPEEKPSEEPLQLQALEVTEAANTAVVREILSTAEACCREVGNSVSDPDGRRRYEGNGVSGPVESLNNTDDCSVQPAQRVSESLSGEDVPASFGEQVLDQSDTQPSGPVSAALCSPLQNDSEGLASHEENGEVEVQDEGRNQGGGCVETSTAISSCKNNAVDMENKHRKLIVWGQSVASRLETLAGEAALQSVPALVRSAIEASIRVSDCTSLASLGRLEESFASHAESHFTRLEAIISSEEATTTTTGHGGEQKGVIDRILGRNFVSLHAATPHDYSQAGNKLGFRSLRPPQRTETGGATVPAVAEQVHLLEADASGPRVSTESAACAVGRRDSERATSPIKPPGAESPYSEHTVQAAEQPSVDQRQTWSSVADGNVADASREVDMDVDMEIDDASDDPAPVPSASTSSSYPVAHAANFLHPMQVGYLGPNLLPAYPVPMVPYSDSLTCSSMWQPPPPPLPVEDWVPPPPPDPDAEITPPPPPDEPPPPIEYSCEASVPAAIPSYPEFTYSTAPNMYYYHPVTEGYGALNGRSNGSSWTGMLATERPELRADHQVLDTSSKFEAEENVPKSSSPVTEAAPSAETPQGVSAGVKRPSKGIRVKKRPHASAVSTTLRSNKKVSNLVNKWMAAKEELQESEEEDEGNALYNIEALERKRQKEIEEWRRQQLASGGALENANFQPLGILDWRERVRRAKKAEGGEDDALVSQGVAASETSPAVEHKQEALKPDLKEINKGLPPGWQAFWDSGSEEVYYGNLSTQETSWDRPQ